MDPFTGVPYYDQFHIDNHLFWWFKGTQLIVSRVIEINYSLIIINEVQ